MLSAIDWEEYSNQMHTPLTILLLANMVRLSALSYTTALVASGQQRLATLSPLLEGGSNLVASILLGSKFGAVGVAAGTLIGGIVGLLGHICYNIPRSQTEIHLSVSQFVISGFMVPLLFMAPLLLITVRAIMGAQPTILLFALVLIAELMLATAMLARDLWNTRRSFR